MRAPLLIALYFVCGILHLNTLFFQVRNTLFEILALPGQFQDHDAFFPGKDGGVEDIECQVEIFGKVAYDRFLNLGFRKSENKNF